MCWQDSREFARHTGEETFFNVAVDQPWETFLVLHNLCEERELASGNTWDAADACKNTQGDKAVCIPNSLAPLE